MDLPLDPSPLSQTHPLAYAILVALVIGVFVFGSGAAGWYFLSARQEARIDKKIARLEIKRDRLEGKLELQVRNLSNELSSLRSKFNQLQGYYQSSLDERDRLIGKLHQKGRELDRAYQHIQSLETRINALESKTGQPGYEPNQSDYAEADAITDAILALREG